MEVARQPRLAFLGVDFVKLDYIAKSRINGKNIEIGISPKVHYTPNNNLSFSILMDINLKFEDQFSLSLLAIGNFLVEKNDDNSVDIRKMFVNANAPAIMFPYVRSFISTLTSNLGSVVDPISIHPIIFQGELEEINDEIPKKEESQQKL